jgi:pyruvate dehydrogenase E2 component (dihydrolipoamide acetyltransferase)
MAEIQMPRLSDSMEEGTILKWLKSPGDEVARGEALVEIETDKATMTYESDAAGQLEIVAAEGDTLPIGAVIARLGGAAEQSEVDRESAGSVDEPPQEAVPESPSAAAGVQGAPPAVAAPAAVAEGVVDRSATVAGDRPQENGSEERVRASPIARRIARERGVELRSVTGSGPGGRVVRADVERHAGENPPTADVAAPAPAAAPPRAEAPPLQVVAQAAGESGEAGSGKGIVTTQEPTRTQQIVARRMSSSKATVPEFTLNAELDMERCVELRRRLQALAGDRRVPSYNDIVVKACGLALREHPRANGAWRDGRFELFSRVNVGVAVAGEGVLVVPTVFDADHKALEEIAAETRRLAERVRDGQVTPPELSGATFTVSNLGMFGVKSFTAVINPPQAAILAVGAVTQRALVVDGELAVRHAMDVTLSCDHRILYGADAARLLARIRELIEEPLALLR